MKIQALVATAAIAGTLGFGMAAPAKADGAASTRNLILGAAVVAGIAIESNVAHKQQLANTVRGYTANGSTVYTDGRVVTPNGQTYYPNNDGQQIACNGQSCRIIGGTGPAYGGTYANGTYDNGGYRNGQGYNAGWNGNDDADARNRRDR